ncbi:MAG: ABC transporter ATP-binding protein [Alphaproteobacteria bacterium]|nr:ABC transporter ATP-binding protein [Alphaproteobacteria bacterium]MDE2110479.1 ABC transporter ATP-binding protein [Alphaproteobacteria bacterium]MDE2493229.1 ABC transporter ATP-binding protein [Alphaproteobacteria bacterium]
MADIVECRNVTKTYRQGVLKVPALQGVDLTIEKGDFASLAGPSGSGKTTLLNIIGGLDRPSSGTVAVDGQDLTQLDNNALADLRLTKIGFVFQAYNLIPVLSAVENVEFILQLSGVAPAARRTRALELLHAVGLDGLENRRPSRLSGGQQQRVAVARALASRPSIVLADEPTANLDSKTAEELIKLMSQLNQMLGITFLMATHDPRVIARTRRHIELTDGKITADERRNAAAAA